MTQPRAAARLATLAWLLAGATPGGCALPRETALQDWSRLAAQASMPADAAGDARRQALSTYFLALAVLVEGRALDFHEAPFMALAARLPAAEAAAVGDISALLRAARDDRPPAVPPRDNSGPTPAWEDFRLRAVLRRSDPPVQLLLAALRRDGPPAPATPPPPPASDDPAARQSALEWQAWQAERAAGLAHAGRRRDALLVSLAEGHALLAAHAGALSLRQTARDMRGAEDRLRRALAALP